MKIRLFLFAACLALAGVFILSCSSDGGGGGDSGGDQQQSYNYCLYIDAQVCVAGPYKDCPAGGIPSNSCPFGDVEPSSSAGVSSCSSSLGGGYTGSYGSLPYEGKTYKTVVIGTQTWMAENLNYAAEGSKCYSNLDSNCDIYGRLYNWETAKTVCPSGWHLPTREEWNVMSAYIGGASTEGKKLKATSGWSNNGNGTDEFGVSALPGGNGYSDGSFNYVGSLGFWWSASKYNSNNAYYRLMYYYFEDAYWDYSSKSSLFSVRCLQD